MKSLHRLLPALFALAATAAVAAPVANETFDQEPDAFFWKKNRGAVVRDGKLHLNAEGDETSFVNAVLETQNSVAQLNFSRAPLIIRLSDIELGGLAPTEKQAFVVFLGSDRSSENSAGGYVRLCLNGDGKATLNVSGPRKDGRVIERTVVARSVAYPVKELTLTLDRQGYEWKIVDSVSPMGATGKWVDEIDWAVWADAAPRLVIKGVRRPSPGSIEAAIGSLAIETK